MFTTDDLEKVAEVVAAGWRSARDRDWSVPAGALEWSCRQTADHLVDCVSAPAFFLASRRTDRYPAGGWSPGIEATPDDYADGLEMAARLMAAVVRGTPDDARAILFQRPEPLVRGPVDFVPRSALELVLHAHDVAAALGIALDPPAGAVARLIEHTAPWPMWTMGGGWSAPASSDDPWRELLRAAGRSPRAS